MKKLLIVMLSAFLLSACSDNEPPTPQTESTPTKADFAKYVNQGVEYDVNDKGVLIFANPKDMFQDFKDFYEDEIKFVSEKPLSIIFNKKLSDDPLELYQEWNQRAVVYAVYKTFTHTPVNEITVEAYPLAENKKGKIKALKQYTIKVTVSRKKALEVLKKYSQATSFNDLVQLEKNNEYRRIGVSGSKLWDQFYHNEQLRPAIIADLIN